MSHGLPPKSWGALIHHNEQRAAQAAERDALRARHAVSGVAFRLLSDASRTQTQYLDALMVRLAHPTASLAECAAKLGLTKDTYAARLRRALKQAEKHQ